MNKIKSFTAVIISMLLLLSLGVYAKDSNNSTSHNDSTLIYKFPIKENISPGVWHKLKKALVAADTLDADLFFVEMNTYGGTVLDADSIRTALLNSPIKSVVFINNNAASAGALISIACDKIYMKPGGSIGAATVVNESGEAMPDKYQSYMRSIIRSTAESHGKIPIVAGNDTTYRWFRDPAIAEAMVDESLYVKGISDSGRVVTFTTREAIEHGFCDGEVSSSEDAIKAAGYDEYEVVEFKESFIDIIIGFLTNPMVSSILIMAIVGGIYFEMQAPGIGFPLIVACSAAVLFFAPHYIEGLAEQWEILLFIVGLVLLAVEIFVIPGFGVAGILGIAAIFASLTLTLIGEFSLTPDDDTYHMTNISDIFSSLLLVVSAVIVGISLSAWLGYKFLVGRVGILKHLSLDAVASDGDCFTIQNETNTKLIGEEATVVAPLRPSGRIEIGGIVYDAISQRGVKNSGDKVVVKEIKMGTLYVK